MAAKKEITGNAPAVQKPMQKALAALNTIPPIKLLEDQRVHSKFVSLYNSVHGSNKGELVYMAEKFHFGKLLEESPKLKNCTPLSLYGAILDVAINQLSLDPRQKLAYLVPQSVNVGTKDKPKYELRARLDIDGRGELLMRERVGQIKHAEHPTLVYEGDTFVPGSDKYGKKILVEYKPCVPRKSNKIIAVFMTIEKHDGTSEFIYFDEARIQDWRNHSPSPNSPAWTKGIAGMVETKCIKHAFKTYPKAPVKGSFSSLKTETADVTEDIDYSFVDDETGEVINVPASQESEAASKETQKEVYGEKPDEKEQEGVTAPVDDDEESY